MAKLKKKDIENFKDNNVIRLFKFIILFIVGLYVFKKPFMMYENIVRVLGISFVIIGVVDVWLLSNQKKIDLTNLDVIFSILKTIIGLFMILNIGKLNNGLTIYFGIYLIIAALNKIIIAIKLLKKKSDATFIIFASSFILLFSGILLLINPFGSMVFTKLAGSFLMIYSLIEASNVMLLNKDKKIVK